MNFIPPIVEIWTLADAIASNGHGDADALRTWLLAEARRGSFPIHDTANGEDEPWVTSLVEVGRVRPFIIGAMGFDPLDVAPTARAPAPQPQAAAPEQQLDYSMLATPDQLIAAFGAMSGMNKGWFRSLKDRRGLHEAVRVPGVRGRNGQPPLLDVFAVLQYLIDPGRTGKKMLPGTGWRLLKSHFPQVYAMYAGFDPDNSN